MIGRTAAMLEPEVPAVAASDVGGAETVWHRQSIGAALQHSPSVHGVEMAEQPAAVLRLKKGSSRRRLRDIGC